MYVYIGDYLSAVMSNLLIRSNVIDLRIPPSAAQRCNEYVLFDIFQYLLSHELAVACTLCKAWLPAARALLYRRIRFSTISPRDSALELTLRSSANIRGLLRYLVLSHPDSSHDHRLDWVAVVPQHTLLSVNLERMPASKGLLSLLQYPAIRTAPQVTIGRSDFLQAEPFNLSTILAFPHLEGFTALLKSIPLRVDNTLRLKRLSLGIVAEDRPQLLTTILQAIQPETLQKLDLLLSSLKEDNVSWLTDLLRPHLPSLKHLAIRTLDHTNTAPIMDKLIEAVPQLETLACGRNTYTSQLFPLLPHRLQSLTLDSGDNEPFPRDELEETITRLCSTQRTLTSLTIGRHPSYPNSLYFDRVARVCRSFGVSFIIVRGRIGEYLTLGVWSH